MSATLRELAQQHRVPIRRGCEEEIVRGKNGFLCADGRKITMVFTDDGRKTPLTAMKKSYALKAMGDHLEMPLHQEGDCEFIGFVDATGFPAALKVLGVKHFTARKGISRPFPVSKESR